MLNHLAETLPTALVVGFTPLAFALALWLPYKAIQRIRHRRTIRRRLTVGTRRS